MDNMIHLHVKNKDYHNAIKSFERIELQMEESYLIGTISEDINYTSFYATYLLCLLVLDKYNEAKYLWKRIPNSYKNEAPDNILDFICNITKFLINGDYPAAISLIKDIDNNWLIDIKNLIINLKDVLVQKYLEMISIAYSVVSLKMLSKSINLSREDMLTKANELNWEMDLTNDMLYPKQKYLSLKSIENMNENTKMIEKFTKYTAHFEQQALKVDFSKNQTL